MPDATFIWDIDASHESYEVTYRNVTDGGPTISVTPPLIIPPNHSKLIQNLLSNKEYEFCVKANCNPDGYTPWICIRSTTPNIPSFLVNVRAYNPNGDGVPTNDFYGGNVANTAQTVNSQDVLTANPTQQTVIHTSSRLFALSDFVNNTLRISVNTANSQCQAIYIKRNGSLVHTIRFDSPGIVTSYNVNMSSANVPHTISLNDVYDIILVTRNKDTVPGDPYVPAGQTGLCL